MQRLYKTARILIADMRKQSLLDQLLKPLNFSIADINECQSGPCENGASCVDNINGYTCSCADGYTGGHCETGKILVFVHGIVIVYTF